LLAEYMEAVGAAAVRLPLEHAHAAQVPAAKFGTEESPAEHNGDSNQQSQNHRR